LKQSAGDIRQTLPYTTGRMREEIEISLAIATGYQRATEL